MNNELKDIKSTLDDISRYSSDAASQASYVDTNTEKLNEKLDRIIELLEIIVENQ